MPVRNEDAKDGLWKVGGKRMAIYAKSDLPLRDRVKAAYKRKCRKRVAFTTLEGSFKEGSMSDSTNEPNQIAHFAVLKRPGLKYDQEDVAQALHKSRGMVFAAARILGCAPNTIYNYLKRYPELRDVQQAERGLLTDTAELKLADAIERGEAWAICFYLKTQAKDRGYVERQEVMGRDPGPIQTVDLMELRREKLTLAIQKCLDSGWSLPEALEYLSFRGVRKEHLELVRGEDLVLPETKEIDSGRG